MQQKKGRCPVIVFIWQPLWIPRTIGLIDTGPARRDYAPKAKQVQAHRWNDRVRLIINEEGVWAWISFKEPDCSSQAERTSFRHLARNGHQDQNCSVKYTFCPATQFFLDLNQLPCHVLGESLAGSTESLYVILIFLFITDSLFKWRLGLSGWAQPTGIPKTWWLNTASRGPRSLDFYPKLWCQ